MKQQINFRASELTARQLDWLMARWGTSQTETLTVVIDRMYQQEIDLSATLAQAQDVAREALAMLKSVNDDRQKCAEELASYKRQAAYINSVIDSDGKYIP
jgi:hypothetical protein